MKTKQGASALHALFSVAALKATGEDARADELRQRLLEAPDDIADDACALRHPSKPTPTSARLQYSPPLLCTAGTSASAEVASIAYDESVTTTDVQTTPEDMVREQLLLDPSPQMRPRIATLRAIPRLQLPDDVAGSAVIKSLAIADIEPAFILDERIQHSSHPQLHPSLLPAPATSPHERTDPTRPAGCQPTAVLRAIDFAPLSTPPMVPANSPIDSCDWRHDHRRGGKVSGLNVQGDGGQSDDDDEGDDDFACDVARHAGHGGGHDYDDDDDDDDSIGASVASLQTDSTSRSMLDALVPSRRVVSSVWDTWDWDLEHVSQGGWWSSDAECAWPDSALAATLSSSPSLDETDLCNLAPMTDLERVAVGDLTEKDCVITDLDTGRRYWFWNADQVILGCTSPSQLRRPIDLVSMCSNAHAASCAGPGSPASSTRAVRLSRAA